jgi:phage terminase small subunit
MANSTVLTVKQQRFVDEYVICLNGTEAARRAGYKGNDTTLAVEASRLIRNAKVSRRVNELLAEFAMPANEVLSQLSDIARSDIADAMDGFGGIDPIEAKRRGKSQLIKRLKTKVTTVTEKDGTERETVETEIEMHDKLSALQALAKFHNLTNIVKVEVDFKVEIIALLKEGKVTPDDVITEVGYDLAQDIFIAAGLPEYAGGEE